MARLPIWCLPLIIISLATVVASDTCSTIAARTSIGVEYPLSVGYVADQAEYWSTASGATRPTCILTPTTAEEVAAIVAVLLTNNENFATKSGGHNPNVNFSSVTGGPLISTKLLNEVILDASSETVRVGPGNKWEDVAAALDGTGYTTVGGRIGDVGVGGYMLGGGFSFMGTQYGWAANNVIEYEIVLANATVVTASATSNPDLFAVLKGGGNAYGIVTSYLLQAHPQGEIWGGNLIFNNTPETTTALLKAVRDFTEYYPDEKAAIIMTAETTLDGVVDLWVMFLYYNGPEPPPGVFDNFTSIVPFSNTCRTQSYSSLVSGNDWAVVRGSVYIIAAESTPLPNATVGLDVMQAFYNHWLETSQNVALVPGIIASIAFQPLPKGMARIAQEKGGDLIDLDDSVDRIFFDYNYSFSLEADFPAMDAATQALVGGTRDLVEAFIANGTLPDAYIPLFMNDAYFRQDYFGRLRPGSLAQAQSVRQAVDPGNLWSGRTGGFKM